MPQELTDFDLPLPRFSLACVEMVLSESLFSCAPADVPAGTTEGDGREAVDTEAGRLLCDNRELDDESAVAALKARFARLPLPAYAQWADPDSGPTRWFGDSGLLLRDDGGTWLWVRCRSDPARLSALRAALPGDWLLGGGS